MLPLCTCFVLGFVICDCNGSTPFVGLLLVAGKVDHSRLLGCVFDAFSLSMLCFRDFIIFYHNDLTSNFFALGFIMFFFWLMEN